MNIPGGTLPRKQLRRLSAVTPGRRDRETEGPRERWSPSPDQSHGKKSWRQKVKRCSHKQQGHRRAGWDRGGPEVGLWEHPLPGPRELGNTGNWRELRWVLASLGFIAWKPRK